MKAQRLALIAAAALAVASSGYAVAQSAAIGVAALVIKEVKLSNAQTPKAKQVALKQRIALGDQVQTGKASRLQILLLDRSSFAIGANAVLKIDRFVYDPARGRDAGASVTKGAFRFLSGQHNSSNRTTIASPVATIGIRGTILDGVVGEGAVDIAKGEIKAVKDAKADKKTATLVVLRGPGSRTSAGAEIGAATVTAADTTVDLNAPMQAAYVPRAGVPPILFRISTAGLAKLQDQINALPKAPGATEKLIGGLLGVLPGIIGDGDSGDQGRTTQQQRSPNDPTGSSAGKP